jgi:pimeloyl-ACP methyl ester carboxylesterase
MTVNREATMAALSAVGEVAGRAEREPRRDVGDSLSSVRAQALTPTLASHAPAGDGARIYYEMFSPTQEPSQRRRLGSPHPWPVLLLMGLGANGRLWAPAVRRYIAAGHHVVTLDNRGSGRSSTPWRPWTTRTMAMDALAVLDELGIEQAHVCGVSMGGMIAQELALQHPRRAGSLVLTATTAGFRPLDLPPPSRLARMLSGALPPFQAGGEQARRVSDFLCLAASDEYAGRCQPGDEAWDAVAAMLEDPASRRGLALQILACMRHSSWSRLRRLSMPVQVHHGTQDPLIPLAAGRELARRIPGARFELHPGAGHGLFERAEQVYRSILAFVAGCETRAAASSGHEPSTREVRAGAPR